MSHTSGWRRVRRGSIALVLLLGLSALPAVGQDGVTEIKPETAAAWASSDPTIESSGLWFVELSSRPGVHGTPARVLNQEHRAFRAAAAQAGLQFEERFAFQTLWNGLSIAIDPSDVSTLWQIPGVKAIYPVETISIPETSTSAPQLATALAMTGADFAQTDLGLTGAGIKVAIMDTGIDYNHPDLGGPCFGDGCRVFTGWDFVGNDFNAADPDNDTPMPDDDPMDCNGHGTHVAGIVGADGDVTGVAPGVTFGAYKVFGCVGSTFSDIMIAAMEMALADGMDVLNMSIGSAFQWPQHPTSVASNNLVDAGMVVVASIGNSGAFGVYSASSPGVGEKVIGVASFDNSHINALTFNVNPSGQQVPYLALATTTDPPTSGDSPEVVWLGRGCVSTLGDVHLDDPDGKVALIVRGDCTFQEKYQGAADAGAVGVVIYNNVTGLFAGGGVTDRGIFGVGISNADGLHIRGLLDDDETVTLTWTDERVDAVNPTGGLISSFSSYGLSPDLDIKPDIGAPGGLIRSTYPLALGGYATISGTSMSSPHVAGAVALLLEAAPGTPTERVRTILQNSADPALLFGIPGLIDNVHRQGAGMLDIPGAIQSTVRVDPGKLPLGASNSGSATTRTLTVVNDGAEAATFDLSFVNAVSTGGSTFAPGLFFGNAAVSFSESTVTVPAGGTATVNATITPATGPDLGQYGGYIVFTPQGGGDPLRVPFAGFIGNYQDLLVLTPGASEFGNPLLRGSLTFGPSEPVVINPDQGDVAWILVHLSHQVRQLRIEVSGPGRGRSLHPFVVADFVGRNSTAGSFFAFPWDGTTLRGNSGRMVTWPDGTYQLTLSVLKALGDPGNPDHWETWTSPPVIIDRSFG